MENTNLLKSTMSGSLNNDAFSHLAMRNLPNFIRRNTDLFDVAIIHRIPLHLEIKPFLEKLRKYL